MKLIWGMLYIQTEKVVIYWKLKIFICLYVHNIHSTVWNGMLYDNFQCLYNKAICFETTEPMSLVLFIVQNGLFQ